MLEFNSVTDLTQHLVSSHGYFNFDSLFPNSKLHNCNFYVASPNSEMLHANQFCLSSLHASNIEQVYQRRVDEIGEKLGWPREIGMRCIENDKIAVEKGYLTTEENSIINDRIVKWQSHKQAIYHPDGKVIAIMGMAILAEEDASTVWLNPKTHKVIIYINPTTCIKLSPKEFIITRELLKGYSALEIAIHLKISNKTVESHISNIRNKFDCNKKSLLIAHLIELGIARDILNYHINNLSPSLVN